MWLAPSPTADPATDRVDSAGQQAGAGAQPAVARFVLPPRPRHLRVLGMRISYVDVGNGPVVLLLHGLGHSIHGWRKNIGPISQAGYRVMAIDLPGFGYSDAPPKVDLETYTSLLREWLDLHCIDRAAVVGNSMGGLISAAFAGMAPDRVWAAVLVDPAGFDRRLSVLLRFTSVLGVVGLTRVLTPRRASARRVRRALRYVYRDRRVIEDEEVEQICEVLSQPQVRQTLLRIGRRATSPLGMRLAMGLGRLPDSIAVPTLVVWGDRDQLVPLSHLESVAARTPGCETAVFENCGHCPMMEVPDLFNERVLRFLAAHVRDGRDAQVPEVQPF